MATVVDYFTDTNNQKYAFAVLDAQYRGIQQWASTTTYQNSVSGLPLYSTSAKALAAPETAKENTDYILNKYTPTDFPAFNFARSAGTVTINDVEYQSHFVNPYELQQIYNNRAKLDELDPSASTSDNTLTNWGFGGYGYASTSCECDARWIWYLQTDGTFQSGGSSSKAYQFAILPVFEIPVTDDNFPLNGCKLTINPTPSDATVVLSCDGYTQEGNSITVKMGKTVNYTVSKNGYETVNESIVVNATQTVDVEMISEHLAIYVYGGQDEAISGLTFCNRGNLTFDDFSNGGTYASVPSIWGNDVTWASEVIVSSFDANTLKLNNEQVSYYGEMEFVGVKGYIYLPENYYETMYMNPHLYVAFTNPLRVGDAVLKVGNQELYFPDWGSSFINMVEAGSFDNPTSNYYYTGSSYPFYPRREDRPMGTHTITVENSWAGGVYAYVLNNETGETIVPEVASASSGSGTFYSGDNLILYADRLSDHPTINGEDITFIYDSVSKDYCFDLSPYTYVDLNISVGYNCCLPYYTQIETRDNGIKTISDIQVGEWIKSWDFEKNEICWVEVLTKRCPVSKNLVRTTFSDGSYYEITHNHVVYTDQGWACWSPENCNDVRDAVKLTPGQKVLLSTGEYEEITNVEYIDYPEGIQCYMLDVTDGNDTFFFIQQGLDENSQKMKQILAHNAPCVK